MKTMTIRQVINEVENLDAEINDWYGKLRKSVSTEDRNICRDYIAMYEKQRVELDKVLDRKIRVKNF